MLLLGQLQQLPVKASFAPALHLLEVLIAASGMLSANVSAQTLRTFEHLKANVTFQ